MPSTLGVFTAGAAALTRWEHAGNEGVLPSTLGTRASPPSTRAGTPSLPALFLAVRSQRRCRYWRASLQACARRAALALSAA